MTGPRWGAAALILWTERSSGGPERPKIAISEPMGRVEESRGRTVSAGETGWPRSPPADVSVICGNQAGLRGRVRRLFREVVQVAIGLAGLDLAVGRRERVVHDRPEVGDFWDLVRHTSPSSLSSNALRDTALVSRPRATTVPDQTCQGSLT